MIQYFYIYNKKDIFLLLYFLVLKIIFAFLIYADIRKVVLYYHWTYLYNFFVQIEQPKEEADLNK